MANCFTMCGTKSRETCRATYDDCIEQQGWEQSFQIAAHGNHKRFSTFFISVTLLK